MHFVQASAEHAEHPLNTSEHFRHANSNKNSSSSQPFYLHVPSFLNPWSQTHFLSTILAASSVHLVQVSAEEQAVHPSINNEHF